MEVELTSSLTSYGDTSTETIYGDDGISSLNGRSIGYIETGEVSETIFYYFRHNGTEPVYNVSIYLRAIGLGWGGYCSDFPDSKQAFNPNVFRSGGLDENGTPFSSTEDYNFMRTSAQNNPEMGIRIHQDRLDPNSFSEGLGYDNKGLSFSPIALQSSTLDFTKSSDTQSNGLIYPTPLDSSKTGQAGDEAKIGMSVKLPEDTVGAGHIQFAVALKYRYTQ